MLGAGAATLALILQAITLPPIPAGTTSGLCAFGSTLRSRIVWLGLLATLAVVLLAYLVVFVKATRSDVTGDEPRYLLMAHSIVYDRDLNLLNQYQQEDYRPYFHAFLPAEMRGTVSFGGRCFAGRKLSGQSWSTPTAFCQIGSEPGAPFRPACPPGSTPTPR